MSGFLNNLSQTLSNLSTTPKQELSETDKAIQDIENRKKAVTQASQNEQNTIKQHIQEEFSKIGETVYKLYEDNSFDIEKVTDRLEIVKGLYQSLNEKQIKLNEILDRYSEELELLCPATPAGNIQGTCPNCQTAYIPGEMLFCVKCGNKLK